MEPNQQTSVGHDAQPTYAQQPVPQQTPDTTTNGAENKDRNYIVALALAYFLGVFGVDRFYLGRIGTGVVKLLTFGGFGIWHGIDMIRIGVGSLLEKGNPQPLEGFAKNKAWGKPTAIVLGILSMLGFIIAILYVVLIVILAANGKLDSTSSSSSSAPRYESDYYNSHTN